MIVDLSFCFGFEAVEKKKGEYWIVADTRGYFKRSWKNNLLKKGMFFVKQGTVEQTRQNWKYSWVLNET